MREETKKKVDKLVAELKALFGERLVSVCVYGSATLGEEAVADDDQHRNINVLVILDKLSHQDLEKAYVMGKWWDAVGHSLPLFLSREEWLRSHDVYAMEAADIRDNHHLVYGQDLFSDVKVDHAALRLICELELHRKLIFIRQRLLLFKEEPDVLKDILHHSLNSFTALFRAVLRLTLTSDQVPQKPAKVFREIQAIVPDFDPEPFLHIAESRDGENKMPHAGVLPLFESYVTQIGHVVDYVDQKHESLVG